MSYPIVGAHFRPPAKAILQILSIGAPLILRKEPENQFDPNAIAVWWPSVTLSPTVHNALDAAAQAYGFDLASIMVEPEWHLGYIPKTLTHEVHLIMEPSLNGEWPGTFTMDPTGKPAITVLTDEQHRGFKS